MNSTKKAKSGKLSVNEAPPVIISLAERRRLKMASAKREEELRARKVREIKARIEEGTYHIDAANVAKSIVRREVARLLSGKRPNSHKRGES
ncbi:MAG TPA: flagellar biosynthesis anti-sigma factor FlgM [Candidatus Binatia bacterium]|jgi:flagellar biosynthesis anti-sigma factor FlgM|nr:flagellar biosynthesis anti-sigma factor FlgM [Candidatus Binatia bacterium]